MRLPRDLVDAWCSPVPPVRLGAVRLAHGLWTSAYPARRRGLLRSVHRTGPELFAPVGPCRVLRAPLPPRVADAVCDLTTVVTALA